jgi:hypothetical protein
MKIIIRPNGIMQFIYNDALTAMLDHGDANIRRASHVEPCGTKWTADLQPVNGPVLGPFTLRQEALDAEIEWLNKNLCDVSS